jgi:hypothetical protein
MLIARLMLIVSVMLCIKVSVAQVGFSEWETAYFSTNATKEQKDFLKKVEFPRSLQFPKIKPLKYGFDNIYCWNIYLRKCFAAFFTESKSYEFNKTATLVYGLLCPGNYETLNYHPQLKSSINDTLWSENIYNSLIPFFSESWKLLDSDTRKIYTEIINHIDNYLKTFNYQSELKYQQQLENQFKQENFTLFSSNSSSKNEYRKAEAFIFRRINDSKANNGNWNILWMRKMIQKLKAELKIS